MKREILMAEMLADKKEFQKVETTAQMLVVMWVE